MKRPILGLLIGVGVIFTLQNPEWIKTMLIDQITKLADDIGIPTIGKCGPSQSRACLILERIEVLFLVDYTWNDHPPLGERFRLVVEKVTA